MTDAQITLAPSTFDKTSAVAHGLVVDACYAMLSDDPGNPTPPLPTSVTDLYDLVGWVQMRDFFLGEGPYVFYGLLLTSKSDRSRALLAIRGTHGFEEWYDDFRSIVPEPWAGPGLVGDGFNRIYATMKIVKPLPAGAPQAEASAAPPTIPFEAQVAAALTAHAPGAAPSAEALAAAPRVDVVGHSLGSALATLYVGRNAVHNQLGTPHLVTFASPLVGDPTFATWFDGLPVTSWRIANDLDIVTKVPFIGFQHVEALVEINSGFDTLPTPVCFHSLDTYLHVLDSGHALEQGCQWPVLAARPEMAAAAVAAAPRATPARDIALSVPAGDRGTTINISIKIG